MSNAFTAILFLMPTSSKYAEERDQNKEQNYLNYFFPNLLHLHYKINFFIAEVGHLNVPFCEPIKITE